MYIILHMAEFLSLSYFFSFLYEQIIKLFEENFDSKSNVGGFFTYIFYKRLPPPAPPDQGLFFNLIVYPFCPYRIFVPYYSTMLKKFYQIFHFLRREIKENVIHRLLIDIMGWKMSRTRENVVLGSVITPCCTAKLRIYL